MREKRKKFMVHESAAVYGVKKQVFCTKCKKGTIGSIPEGCKVVLLTRGKPPPDQDESGLTVNCPVCGTYWTFASEN